MSDTRTATETGSRERRVATSIDAAAGTITVSYNRTPIGVFDVNDLPDLPPTGIVRDLAMFAASMLLARAASNKDNPAGSVAEISDRLASGEWKPGRWWQKIEREPEPIVLALSQHLGQSADYIIGTYLPRYCQAQGHITTNGRLLMDRAKRELERHEHIAPLVAKIIAQRATQDGTGHMAVDLAAIDSDSEDQSHKAAE